MIIVNWNSYTGNSISILGNKIIIDWKDVTPDAKNITIDVFWNLKELNCDNCDSITINWKIEWILKTMSWDVQCQNVLGDVKTMSWDVRARNISWSVSTINWDIKELWY